MEPEKLTPNQILHVRLSLNMTRAQFGEEIGVGIYSVQSYELGRKNPSRPVLMNIYRLKKQVEKNG